MRRKQFFTVKHKISGLFMLAALIWLTISLPFIYVAQQQLINEKIAAAGNTPADKEYDADNPFANTTEEKTPNSVNTISEEYLHDTHFQLHHFPVRLSHIISGDVATYVAYHGELLSPPPEV